MAARSRFQCIALAALAVAGCGPTGGADDARHGHERPRAMAVAGPPPPPGTPAGKAAAHCSRPLYCGGTGLLDCDSAVDGPTYYFERSSGRILCSIDWGVATGACPPWPCDMPAPGR